MNKMRLINGISVFLRQFSIYDWLRIILTILCNICSFYTVFYGFMHIFETHSIAFLVTGFLSFFTIYKLYDVMKKGGKKDE
jgi:hypothetical protein